MCTAAVEPRDLSVNRCAPHLLRIAAFSYNSIMALDYAMKC
jgi:hypothetical protein